MTTILIVDMKDEVELKRQFKSKCAERGYTMRHAIMEFMKKVVADQDK